METWERVEKKKKKKKKKETRVESIISIDKELRLSEATLLKQKHRR